MAAELIVRREDNTQLYATSKSVFGLRKSGPVTYIGVWYRKRPDGTQHFYYDNVYEFRVPNAISPIVFTVGMCNQPFMSKEGNDTVFYFAGAVSGIKVYCFDIMQPIFTGPGLKTREISNQFTFNSLQNPLNVVATSTAPAPSGLVSMVGGYEAVVIPEGFNNQGFYNASFYSVGYGGGVEYAAHIPWARTAFLTAFGETTWRYGMHEGCYGQLNGIVHHFGISAESTCGTMFSTTPLGFTDLIGSPRPSCLVINASQYPYPYNPA